MGVRRSPWMTVDGQTKTDDGTVDALDFVFGLLNMPNVWPVAEVEIFKYVGHMAANDIWAPG